MIDIKTKIAVSLLFLAFSWLPRAESASVRIPRIDGIEIDGNAADWEDGGYGIPFFAQLEGQVAPESDFAGSARVGWDGSGVNVLLRVSDDIASEAAEKLYEGDSVEFFVAEGSRAKNWFQAIVAAGTASAHPEVRISYSDHRADRSEPPAIQVAREIVPGGYVLEARIPWGVLGVEPKVGTELGLQIVLNDRDGGEARTQYPWFPGTDTYRDQTQMVGIALAETADPPVAGVVRVERRGPGTILRFAGAREEAERELVVRSADGETLARAAAIRGRAGIELPSEAMSGELVVLLDGKELTRLEPGSRKVAKESIERMEFTLVPTVFAGNAFPKFALRERAELEVQLGPLEIATTFYNADFERVTAPGEPGRYGVVFEITTAGGGKTTRHQTLYRLGEKVDWKTSDFEFGDIGLPSWLAPDPAVAEEQRRAVGEVFRDAFRDTFETDPRSAMLLAGMHESKAQGVPATRRDDIWRRDADWWSALRKRTGDLQPYDRTVYLPKGYGEEPGKRWPLVLFLHGSGDGATREALRKWGPPREVAEGREFPFILVSPRSPPGQWMWWFAPQVGELLDEIEAKYRVDPDRIYVTGLSMGGYGAWNLAGEFPDRLAAIAPFCGGGDPEDAARIAHLPIWAFHGEKDNAVPVERTREMIAAIEAAGGSPKVTYYPDVGHVCWQEAYTGRELYDWLLRQRRSGREPQPQP